MSIKQLLKYFISIDSGGRNSVKIVKIFYKWSVSYMVIYVALAAVVVVAVMVVGAVDGAPFVLGAAQTLCEEKSQQRGETGLWDL